VRRTHADRRSPSPNIPSASLQDYDAALALRPASAKALWRKGQALQALKRPEARARRWLPLPARRRRRSAGRRAPPALHRRRRRRCSDAM
jgi:hypothetical protein